MDPRQVWVAVPTRGQVGVSTFARLEDIRERVPDLGPIHFEIADTSVADARNRIVRQFLGSEAEVLVMVDDDVIPPLDVLELAGHGLDIVAAPCPISLIGPGSGPAIPTVYVWDPEAGYTFFPDPYTQQGLTRCDAIGAGCVAIQRRVLEHPALRAPFAIRRFTEDVSFCHRARAAGFEVWADFDRPADHAPSRAVQLSLGDVRLGLAEAKRAITAAGADWEKLGLRLGADWEKLGLRLDGLTPV